MSSHYTELDIGGGNGGEDVQGRGQDFVHAQQVPRLERQEPGILLGLLSLMVHTATGQRMTVTANADREEMPAGSESWSTSAMTKT